MFDVEVCAVRLRFLDRDNEKKRLEKAQPNRRLVPLPCGLAFAQALVELRRYFQKEWDEPTDWIQPEPESSES